MMRRRKVKRGFDAAAAAAEEEEEEPAVCVYTITKLLRHVVEWKSFLQN